MDYTKPYNKDYKYVIGIDPGASTIDANGAKTGIYCKFGNSLAERKQYLIEIPNCYDAVSTVTKITTEIEKIQRDTGWEATMICVEEPWRKTQDVMLQIQETQGVCYILKAVYSNRYVGITPSQKSSKDKVAYKTGKAWLLNKKSSHIVDARLVYDVGHRILNGQNVDYRNFKGESIRGNEHKFARKAKTTHI